MTTPISPARLFARLRTAVIDLEKVPTYTPYGETVYNILADCSPQMRETLLDALAITHPDTAFLLRTQFATLDSLRRPTTAITRG